MSRARVGILGRLPEDLDEAGAQLNAAVRGAGNVLSLGTANAADAALAATVGYGSRSSSWGDRYRENLRQQNAQDDYDVKHRAVAHVAGDLGGVAALYRLGVPPGTTWVRGLPPMAKGKLGERLSLLKTIAMGDIPTGFQKAIPLSKGKTIADSQTLFRKGVVESKLWNKYPKNILDALSAQQKRAMAELGKRYRYDAWRPEHVGRMSGAMSGSAGGAAAVNDGRR